LKTFKAIDDTSEHAAPCHKLEHFENANVHIEDTIADTTASEVYSDSDRRRRAQDEKDSVDR
jgi:hypothetical protein